MESALLERQQHGLLGVASSTLGEHVDALSLGLDLAGGALHSITGILAKGDLLERSLGGNTAVLGEHSSQHENVELGLVVADKDSRARGSEDIVRVLNDKLNAGGVEHEVVKGATDSPLRDALLADEGEEDGGKDTVGGDDEERDVGGETAGGKGSLGNDEGHGV
ncbi:hypothetical protein HG531_011397 [Fusarium graminearum]|nr:hypothetical protein HG531_011397 [Fusarium graminearum]